MKYFEEAKKIWTEYVPQSGQSETVQGELLRAVEKLRDEAIRNGNGNWDNGFDILLAYIAVKLNDADVFEPDRLKKIETVLNRLKGFEAPYLEDDYYDFLGDCVVDYFNHYGSQPHEYNPQLFR